MLILLANPVSELAQIDSVGIVVKTLNDIYQGLLSRLPYIIIGLIVLAIFLVIGKIISFALHKVGQRTPLDVTLSELLGRLAYAVTVILGIFVAAVVVFPTFNPGDLIAGLGITSVAVGFAFKDVLQNFFAGILILWRRPFVIGDEIAVKEFEGTVENINVRSTRIKTYDGDRAVVPNSDVYTSALLVKTAYPVRRRKFTVGIGYLDDIEKARRIMMDALKTIPEVEKEPEPSVFVSELAASSVNFTVYVWAGARVMSPRLNDKVATAIKYALDEAKIDMPYPHSVILFHDVTGSRTGDNEPLYLRANRESQAGNGRR
jgi:small conductance mechanosensitive channel